MPTSSWNDLAKSSKYDEKSRRNGAEIYVEKRNLRQRLKYVVECKLSGQGKCQMFDRATLKTAKKKELKIASTRVRVSLNKQTTI